MTQRDVPRLPHINLSISTLLHSVSCRWGFLVCFIGLFRLYHWRLYARVRCCGGIYNPQIKTVLKGCNSIQYYGRVMWNLIPAEMKYVDSLETLKSKIRM